MDNATKSTIRNPHTETPYEVLRCAVTQYLHAFYENKGRNCDDELQEMKRLVEMTEEQWEQEKAERVIKFDWYLETAIKEGRKISKP